MTDIDDRADAAEPVDGRVARRQRNIDAVLDVVLEMFAEDAMFPTIEQAATRSGLSLRSLYRYFADPGELLEATVKRSNQVGRELARLRAIGEGPLEDRIEDFVAMRLRLHDGIGSVFRATAANAARHPRIRNELEKNRNDLREQFELQFAPELRRGRRRDRDAVVAAGDLLTQLESIEFLRRHRQLSVAETRAALTTSLRALLG
jgi:AcrR family transcriptional regulator